MVRAGLEAIYLSGWQVAADANLAGQTYPDQSLYPANSVPALVRRLNNALLRADQIDCGGGPRRHATGSRRSSPTPRPASAAPLNAFELMKAMIEAGAAGVHFEDQLAAEKKCGHLGGKVLVPTSQFIRTLAAARLAADVLDVPTVLVARTDALSATLLTSDIDPADAAFLTGERTAEGFFRVRDGHRAGDRAVARLRAVRRRALVRDLDARPRRGPRVRRGDPRAASRASCWPTTARRRSTGSATSTTTRSRASSETLGELGYRFQFITLAGFHSLNASMFELARDYAADGMTAYVELQEREFALEAAGYTATRHQREVGAGYFDRVAEIVERRASPRRSRSAGSTEEEQFESRRRLMAAGIEVHAAGDGEILSPEALGLVERLHRELNADRLELLERRHERAARARCRRAARLRLDARGTGWQVAPAPAGPARPAVRDHRARPTAR